MVSVTRKLCHFLTCVFFVVVSVFGGRGNGAPGISRGGGGAPGGGSSHMLGCDFAKKWGYDCEVHKVTTKDGYILTLHRIPRGHNNNCTNHNKVLILQHGFLGASTVFMIRQQSLGYLFADDCYDVWLPNSRGNTYSLQHERYTIADQAFWNFSFDEMADYDLPTCVEYISKETSQESMYYIGHSQGTTIAFMAFSENKELAKKIRFLGVLAPVGYTAHVSSHFDIVEHISDKMIYLIFGRKSLFSYGDTVDLVETVCTSTTACAEVGETIAGEYGSNMNRTRLRAYYTHPPSGTSVKDAVHWAQWVRTKESRKYDFGSTLGNVIHYGTAKPPKIQFDKADVPVAVYSGGKDIFADPIDVGLLVEVLPNVISKDEIRDYGHLDFIWAKDIVDTLFKPLSNKMKKY